MSAVRRLGELSREYESRATAYQDLAITAAGAESDYKHAKARFMVTAKMEDPKVSQAALEMMADADPAIAALLADRLLTAAMVEAARHKLNQLREAVSVGRSVYAGERAADQIHATGTGGAA